MQLLFPSLRIVRLNRKSIMMPAHPALDEMFSLQLYFQVPDNYRITPPVAEYLLAGATKQRLGVHRCFNCSSYACFVLIKRMRPPLSLSDRDKPLLCSSESRRKLCIWSLGITSFLRSVAHPFVPPSRC